MCELKCVCYEVHNNLLDPFEVREELIVARKANMREKAYIFNFCVEVANVVHFRDQGMEREPTVDDLKLAELDF